MAAAGVAPVRERFVTSKEQFHAYLRANGELGGQEGDREEEKEASSEQSEPPAKRGRLDVQGQDGESPGEPEDGEKESRDGEKEPEDGEKEPVERKRARGQNKSRPCMKPNHYEKSRLCPSVTQGCADKCYFGPRCRFLHDVGEYMAAKPADLGPSCVLFETFGKCPYGITCRFAKAHLGDGYQNVVNTELAKQWEGKSLVRNNLSKDLQHQLRKKKFTFKKADEYLCSLAKPHHDDRKGGKAPGCSAEGEEVSNCTTPEDGLGDPSQCPVLPEGGDSKPAPVQSPQPTESRRGCPTKTAGPVTDEDIVKLRSCEKKKLEIQGKLYLAPLTTCGNLPFRRICKRFGADVTCGEMAVCTNLLQGQSSEWALLKRHHTEDIFGVQLEGAFPDTMTKCAELLNQTIDVDFVDINVGCPIDLVYKKGGGCALMTRSNKFEQIVRGMNSVSPTTGLPAGEQQVELNCFSSLTLPSLQVLDVPLTVKIRTGVQEKMNVAHKIIPKIREWGASMVTLHGRSREQRYTRVADWDYIAECAKIASPMPLFGNGDILSYEDADQAMQTGVSGIMIARSRDTGTFPPVRDLISSKTSPTTAWSTGGQILRVWRRPGSFCWNGSRSCAVFVFCCRYIPVGLLERLPQKINERPPYYIGRDYLETLMASQNVDDWIKISELLLGPVPTNFTFLPKHKANSYR
ncbi:tRNA-dihydrouridine(47) synthase [NAD(P)(+)]-like isoform X2 [Centrocercus urophasianus]|uniref:tRNA-dihydrouridine(47) synthase [NAD(P)(+)]-like isoform X2 n=1 Tax=Centrocercus urophasianus TaxID=9002 RepID=UPI001C6495B3|nr:tRNA-dihydrouridine(47) synthase [NAD(P)(+)]-like isoform X2 [Centrocercus urophasianus]